MKVGWAGQKPERRGCKLGFSTEARSNLAKFHGTDQLGAVQHPLNDHLVSSNLPFIPESDQCATLMAPSCNAMRQVGNACRVAHW